MFPRNYVDEELGVYSVLDLYCEGSGLVIFLQNRVDFLHSKPKVSVLFSSQFMEVLDLEFRSD